MIPQASFNLFAYPFQWKRKTKMNVVVPPAAEGKRSVWITNIEYAKILGIQGRRPLIRQENHRWQTGEESLYRITATREVRKRLYDLRRKDAVGKVKL